MVFSLEKKPVVLLSHRTGTGVIVILWWVGIAVLEMAFS